MLIQLHQVFYNIERTYDFQYIVYDKIVKVHPVAFSNFGTALIPYLQFDEDHNVNVGLENKY